MSVQVVARRYARALVELGGESGQLDRLVDEIQRLAQAYDSSAEMRNAIENPLIAHAAKKAVMTELGERLSLGPIAKNLSLMLVDRRRMQTITYIAQYVREMSDSKKGLLRAEVTSAAPLSEDYYARLQQQLERMTGKRVAVDRKQDPSLIAGVVTRIGDRVFDGSLKTRLHSMRDSLLPN